MCTAIILKQNNSKWPFIISFNRDESFSRKTLSPGRNWKNYPNIVASKDLKEGGTWFGINDYGIFVCLLNIYTKDLNIHKDYVSRGLLVTNILKEEDLTIIKDKYIHISEFKKYRGFNLVISNYKQTYWIRYDSRSKRIIKKNIQDGIFVLTNDGCNNFNDKKIAEYYDYFNSANSPDPDKDNWSAWNKLMIKQSKFYKEDLRRNICFNLSDKYGTVSCSQLALSKNNTYKYRYSSKQPFFKNFKDILV